MSYAATTTTPIAKTKAEIESYLMRKGAEGFSIMNETNFAALAFRMQNRFVRFKLNLPDRNERRFFYNNGRNKYSPKSNEAAFAQWEQECRSKWRALYLGIKAKIEIVESGITTFEEEFSAQTVMPNGQTLFEYAEPQIKLAYQNGIMPNSLMLGYSNEK